MLECFDYIRNVGRFLEVKEAPALDVLTLIFSENGLGKTTICAICRAASERDPVPILERRRLSGKSDSKVVIAFDGGKTAAFDGTAWNAQPPRFYVFDEHFIDANVHSGLSVDATHRQNLHELVLGEEGGRILKSVRELREASDEARRTLQAKERAIPSDARGSLSVKDFCALPRLEDVDERIKEAEAAVLVLRNAEAVRTAADFSPFALPSFDRVALEKILATSLTEIDKAALDAVSAHLAKLGPRSEEWVSAGMSHAQRCNGNCPYCGQSLGGAPMVDQYRDYFSEAYRTHKGAMDRARADIASRFSGDELARVQRRLAQTRELVRFWAPLVSVPAFEINADRLARVWTSARDHVLALLDKKVAAPLDPIAFSAEAYAALDTFSDEAAATREAHDRLAEVNPRLAVAREQAGHGNLGVAETHVATLRSTKRRYAPEVDAICYAYLVAKQQREQIEEERGKAGQALNEYREKVFGTYQAGINRFLGLFFADFSIAKLDRSDAAGVPSTMYCVVVNQAEVPLSRSDKAEPSFKTALSAGDRNTLALAFFFAHLEMAEKAGILTDSVVVIDDPASSLDGNRSDATAQEIDKLRGRVQQLIVLSHSLPLLLNLWDRWVRARATPCTLKIANCGRDQSTIQEWDAQAASITEHDRRHQSIRDFAGGKGGPASKVAREIRPHIEGYLRAAFPDQMPPGRMLRAFIDKARQLERDGTPILSNSDLQSLEDLRQYTGKFHHENPDWVEAISNVNERQLQGYAQRAIDFMKRPIACAHGHAASS